jgi:hypothetical protein
MLSKHAIHLPISENFSDFSRDPTFPAMLSELTVIVLSQILMPDLNSRCRRIKIPSPELKLPIFSFVRRPPAAPKVELINRRRHIWA